MSKIKSLFLGPNAENLIPLRNQVDDIILDAAFLRRNYQPGDKPLITESDKLQPDYVDTIALMRQKLQPILADLKKSVPTYHPRHVGHMNADVFITGIAGFLGAMMYNPNNIINVASPSTTDMEVAYLNQLCAMVGYEKVSVQISDDISGSWGHLCSGGTSANIEALWVLRNLKYFPVSLKLAAEELKETGEFEIESLGKKKIAACSFKDLFNLSPDEIYELVEKVAKSEKLSEEKNRDIFEKYTVQMLGVAGIHDKLPQTEKLDLPKVFISHTRHYSWMKAMDILGLGRGNLVFVETDEDFRMDYNSLEKELAETGPVLAVVNIMGTTEEGAFDPLEKIISLRKTLHKQFFVHVDGAYGGYFASMLNGQKASVDLHSYLNKIFQEETGSDVAPKWEEHFNFDDTWIRRVKALREADSITIDPHKLGYIPYPAGAILFKESLTRYMTRTEAPYVSSKESRKENEIYLGQWTLEGSRPGAAAVACYYSGEVLGLDAENHGRLLACTVIGAAKLFEAIDRFNENPKNGGFSIIPLFKTDSNCVCYIIANKGLIKSPTLLNKFTKAVMDELTIQPGEKIIPDYDFIISTSSWDYDDYQSVIKDILVDKAGIGKDRMDEMTGKKLQYIRSVMMNPLAAYEPDSFFDDYVNHIGRILKRTLTKVYSELILNRGKEDEEETGKTIRKRFNILWIENEGNIEDQKHSILTDPEFGYGINIDFETYSTSTKKHVVEKLAQYDAILVDLNLKDNNHKEDPKTKWDYCLDIIKAIRKKDWNARVLVCSEYLSEDNEHCQGAREGLLDKDNELNLDADNLVPKNRQDDILDFEGNKFLLIQKIFSSLQRPDSLPNPE